MLNDAIHYHDLGLTVIPIRADDKKPTVAWKAYQSRRPSEATVRRWFNGGAALNIAAIMRDGVIVRDFDAMASFDRWAAAHVELARALPTVATPRPGRHVYAKADIKQITEASASGGSIITFEDGELRGGGYCILPPSTHPNGTKYEWINPLTSDIPVVDLHEAGFLQNPPHLPVTQDMSSLGPLCNTVSSVSLCVTESDLKKIQAAITRTIPTRPGKRHRLVFDLAREFKAIESLAEATFDTLRPYVREWHRLAIDVIQTKDFTSTWMDFVEGWSKVRFAAGEGPLDLIVQRAMKADPPKSALAYDDPSAQLLVAIFCELQKTSGTEPFYLSARAAARAIGTNQMHANRMMRMFQADGILQCTDNGDRSKRRAAEYVYLGNMQ